MLTVSFSKSICHTCFLVVPVAWPTSIDLSSLNLSNIVFMLIHASIWAVCQSVSQCNHRWFIAQIISHTTFRLKSVWQPIEKCREKANYEWIRIWTSTHCYWFFNLTGLLLVFLIAADNAVNEMSLPFSCVLRCGSLDNMKLPLSFSK